MKSLCVLALLGSSITAGIASAEGDIAVGKEKSAACVACHMADGNSVNPEWPKIAGQSKHYIIKQLNLFKTKSRTNPLMDPQAMMLSDQDIENLAAYFESQATSAGATDKGLFELGQSIYRGGNPATGVPACLSCHGPNGSGNPAAGFPKLSYQHSKYTSVRLKQYRKGVSYLGSEIMNGVSQMLTDTEIEAVSSYIQGLH